MTSATSNQEQGSSPDELLLAACAQLGHAVAECEAAKAAALLDLLLKLMSRGQPSTPSAATTGQVAACCVDALAGSACSQVSPRGVCGARAPICMAFRSVWRPMGAQCAAGERGTLSWT